ncbi:hypothetical protein AB0A95_03225 [Micromonospora sp. NPDC049230]|uniref:hypothetical protein n=1 Tax=Micromonospora sp. NPDC049230 TaxID=3155502 RepID=UPI0033E06619
MAEPVTPAPHEHPSVEHLGGCSELIATDTVTVYVFPDETSAADTVETRGGHSYRRGAVVLNYLEAKTLVADRPRYEKVLNGLR